MANPATTGDLEVRWRELTEREVINGETFLDDAWRMLVRRSGDLETRMAADAGLTAEVVRIVATAVLRVMKNPDGKRQESIDDYSWTRDQAVSAGLLYFTDEELDAVAVGVRGRAFKFSLLPTGYPDSTFS